MKEYDTPIAKGLNNLSTQSTFNFNFQNYNELEINQFFSHSYRYFSDMPNELKMMFASNGEWRNYCLTFAGNLPTNQLLNSLNEIFTSLSRLKSPIKNEIVFKALIDIAKKGELAECVGGSIIRILPLIHMDYIFNYVYYYYKEKLANLILSNDTGKRLVPRADEAHLIIYLDHLLMNIPIEKIKFRDARASHLNKSEIKILVNRYKTKELEKYLANEFYTMVKGLFTYIFQEIEKGKQDISPILDKTIDLYKENILVLLPQNKKLHDYIIFKDSMPTNEIDEFLLLKDIVENAKPFLKSKKEFRSIFNTILLKQFAGFSDSHDEIRRIRKSSNFYFAKFIRDNLYRWVELDATVKDLIFSLFENSDKRKSALLINILDTDNFFGLSMSRKFELLAGIRSNESDAYFHKLIKEFSSPKKIT